MRMLAGRLDIFIVAWALLGLAVSGCTFDKTSHTRIDINRPAGKAAIPLSVGVYFSPEFLAFEHRRPRGGMDAAMIFKFGQMSADLFDGAISTAFEEVHFLDTRVPVAADHPPIAAVIEPRIKHAAVHGDFGYWTVIVTYNFKLYDSAGNPVMSWTVRGTGLHDARTKFISTGAPHPALDAAMKQAGENLMEAFYSDPEITEWLETQGVGLADR